MLAGTRVLVILGMVPSVARQHSALLHQDAHEVPAHVGDLHSTLAGFVNPVPLLRNTPQSLVINKYIYIYIYLYIYIYIFRERGPIYWGHIHY